MHTHGQADFFYSLFHLLYIILYACMHTYLNAKPWTKDKKEYLFIVLFTACPEYWFGIGCKYECHCKKNDKCDINGICKSGCAAGWTGNNCQKSKWYLHYIIFVSFTYFSNLTVVMLGHCLDSTNSVDLFCQPTKFWQCKHTNTELSSSGLGSHQSAHIQNNATQSEPVML